MIVIFALILALILPALAVFWRLNRERPWIIAVRFTVAVTAVGTCMALAQYYEMVLRVRDGRSQDMVAASASYIFGPEFWFIPGTLYAGVLLLIRVLILRHKKQLIYSKSQTEA
jgi:hypothetical protein